jgi:uncharacterized OB-fold protein
MTSTHNPDVTWHELRPYWEGTRAGELRFPRCDQCGDFQWYPEPMCGRCYSQSFTWVRVAPRGTVFSYTILRRSFVPELEPATPLPIVLIDIDEAPGVRLVTNVRGDGAVDGALRIGARVRIEFEDVGDAVLPIAVLEEAGGDTAP